MLFLIIIALPWESVFIKCHVKRTTMTVAVLFNEGNANRCTPKKDLSCVKLLFLCVGFSYEKTNRYLWHSFQVQDLENLSVSLFTRL